MFYSARLVRWCSYTTVNILTVLSPLLIYHITHSIHLAGLIITVELFVKYLCYIYGSVIINVLSDRLAHRCVVINKMMASIIIAGVAVNYLPWQSFFVSGILIQTALAIINILYEKHTVRWKSNSAQHAYTSWIQADILAALLAFFLGWYMSDLRVIAAIGVVFAIGNVITFQRNMCTLYEHHEKIAYSIEMFVKPWRVFFDHINLSLIRFILASMCMSLPIALMYSHILYYMEYARGVVTTNEVFNEINIIRTLLSLVAMTIAAWYTKKYHGPYVTICGVVGWLLSVIAMIVNPHDTLVVVVYALGISYYLLTPWLRAQRLEVLSHLPDKEKTTMIGFMIAIDSLSYWLAGVFVLGSLSLINVTIVVYIGCLVGVMTLGLPLLQKLRISS